MAFTRVARAADIPVGHGTFVETGGATLAVFNAGGGRFYACNAICPHEDGPLSEGWVEGDRVVCPWHGFDFDMKTGYCLAEAGLSVSVYPARLSGDMVEVDLP